MSEHLDLLLGPLDLDQLAPGAREEAEEHLRACSGCARGLRESADALSLLALALPEEPPPDGLWSRIEASLTGGRFAAFVERTARLLDLPLEAATALLGGIDDAARWVVGPGPGVSLYHLTPGPAVADAVAGFVRIDPGATFPRHEHLGTERVLVLQGACFDDHGVRASCGDEIVGAAGASHVVTAEQGEPLIYLAVVEQGLRLDGVEVRGNDPRF